MQAPVNFSKFQENIFQVSKQFVAHREEAILFYGYTGEGKTTLLNCIAQASMRGIKAELGKFKFFVDNPIDGTIMESGIASQTLIPFFFLKFCDTQGLGDSRGPIQEIINAFSLYTIARNTEKIKILIVVSENTLLEERKSKLMKLILSLSQTFQNTDALIQGICLVVTQTQLQDPDDIREVFTNILKEEDESQNFSVAQKKIFKHLASRQSQIAFFHSPKSVMINMTNDDREQILRAVENIQYIVKPQPSITISNDSIQFIQEQLNMIYDDVANIISNQFTPSIKTYLNEQISNHRSVLADLRSQFTNLRDELCLIRNRPDEFQKNIKKVLLISQMIEKDDFRYQIEEIILKLETIKQIKPQDLQINGNTEIWYHHITSILDELQFITSPAISFNDTQGIIKIKGPLVGVDDIKNATQLYDFFGINITCSNSFFIDENLFMEGKNLTFNTTNLIIVGQRMICLKGLASGNHQVQKACNGIQSDNTEDLSRIGIEGHPGMIGFNGGNFKGNAQKIIGLSKLTINVSGGQGGIGQDGGDGAQGYDGDDGGQRMVESREASSCISRKIIKAESFTDYLEKILKMLTTFNEKYEEIYQSFSPGQQGGAGGQGGVGGNGGKPGVVIIDYCIEDEQRPIILDRQGNFGCNGQAGYPGEHGEDGPTFRGVYINELMIPSLRSVQSFDEKSAAVILGSVIATATTGVVLIAGNLAALVTVLAMAIVGGAYIVVQGLVISPISAFASSQWRVHPYQVNIDEEGSLDDSQQDNIEV